MSIIKGHECIFGKTQYGKTYYAKKRMEEHDGPVLFWNPQRVQTSFTKANGKYEYKQLEELLSRGGKINYIPIFKKAIAKEELDYIVQKIYESVLENRIKDLLFCVDECHIYGERTNNPLEDIATGGLGLGYYGLFITQRPAKISNTLFSQSDIKTYFYIDEEEWEYFRKQHIPIEMIQKKIRAKGNGGKYYYVQRINGEYTEAMKK